MTQQQTTPLVKYLQKMAWEGRELEQRQNRLFVEVNSVLKKLKLKREIDDAPTTTK